MGFLVLSSGESREEARWWLGSAPPGRVRKVEETGGILQTIALETREELQGDPLLFGVQILQNSKKEEVLVSLKSPCCTFCLGC